MCVLVALLSPAAAIPPLHCHVSKDTRPQLWEQGHNCAVKQSAGQLPSAQGPLRGWGHGLGTWAGHRHPHMASTCVPRGLGDWSGGIVGVGAPALSSEPLPNSLLCTNSCFLFSECLVVSLIPSWGSRETAFFCWDSCTPVSSLISCRNHRRCQRT